MTTKTAKDKKRRAKSNTPAKDKLEKLIARIREYNRANPVWPWMVLSSAEVNIIDKASAKVKDALHIRIEDVDGNILSPEALMALYHAGKERNIAVCHADYFNGGGDLSEAVAALLSSILGYEHAAEGKQVPDYMADEQALAQRWPGIEWMPATKAQEGLRHAAAGLIEVRIEDEGRAQISTKAWSLLDPSKRRVGMRLTPAYRRQLDDAMAVAV